MESRASLSLPCVPCEPGPRSLTPSLGYLRPKRDSVCACLCVGMCQRVESIRGWLSHDPVPTPCITLPPIFISQAIKHTHTQTQTHTRTPSEVVRLSRLRSPPGLFDLSYFMDMSSCVLTCTNTHSHTCRGLYSVHVCVCKYCQSGVQQFNNCIDWH